MATVKVALPADLVLDVMVLADIRSAQDAVEAVLRDYVQRGRRTEAVTGNAAEGRQPLEERPGDPNVGGS
jgi:Arc/MetJ family transcription regulator